MNNNSNLEAKKRPNNAKSLNIMAIGKFAKNYKSSLSKFSSTIYSLGDSNEIDVKLPWQRMSF